MHSPPFPRYLVPPRSKYSPQHLVLKHPQLSCWLSIVIILAMHGNTNFECKKYNFREMVDTSDPSKSDKTMTVAAGNNVRNATVLQKRMQLGNILSL